MPRIAEWFEPTTNTADWWMVQLVLHVPDWWTVRLVNGSNHWWTVRLVNGTEHKSPLHIEGTWFLWSTHHVLRIMSHGIIHTGLCQSLHYIGLGFPIFPFVLLLRGFDTYNSRIEIHHTWYHLPGSTYAHNHVMYSAKPSESHWNYGNDYMYTHWKYLSLERIFYRSFLPLTHAEEWWWGKYFWHLCVLLRWGAKYILIPSSSSENALLAQVNLPLRWGIYLL